MSTKKQKILIGSPSYDGKFDVYFIDSLLNTLSQADNNNAEIYPIFICNDSLIQRARNDIFKIAYEADIDMLIFIDSDIGWKTEDFYKLVKNTKDIVGGSYRKKTDNQELYVVKALDKNSNKLNLNTDKDNTIEVLGLGCGFLKISKKAIKILWENSKSYETEKGLNKMVFEVVCEDNDLISEDIYMCKKWINLGNKIYLDTSITCSHTGTKTFFGDINRWLHSFENKDSNNMHSENLSQYFQDNQEEDDTFKVL